MTGLGPEVSGCRVSLGFSGAPGALGVRLILCVYEAEADSLRRQRDNAVRLRGVLEH